MEIYSHVILTIIAIFLGIIALRINVHFNINDWLQERKKMKRFRLQNICPHTTIVGDGENISIKSDFVSPAGTMQWQCQTCKVIKDHVDDNDTKYWANNIDEYNKRKERFYKGLKKLGYT